MSQGARRPRSLLCRSGAGPPGGGADAWGVRWQVSRSTGKAFYRHAVTGESRWKPPRGATLLPGVAERIPPLLPAPDPAAPVLSPGRPAASLLSWSAKLVILRVKDLSGAGACSGAAGLRAQASLVSADSGLSERQHLLLDHASPEGREGAAGGGLEMVALWESEGGQRAEGEWGQQAVLSLEQPDVGTLDRIARRGRLASAQVPLPAASAPLVCCLFHAVC